MNSFETKNQIIYDLLDAGNQCLIRFSDHNELASERDKRVFLLYQCLERFFLHGLKENHNLFNLTRKMISNSLSNSPKHVNRFTSPCKNKPTDFWQFVTFFLNKHEIQRFTRFKNIKTPIGRCRAWIRSSLNEHSLERFLKSMLDNGSTIVKQFYNEHAAIRDSQKQNEILDLVVKLNTILFASTIDNPNLNLHSLDDIMQEEKSHSIAVHLSAPRSPAINASASTMIIKSNACSTNENEEKTSLNSDSLSHADSAKADLNLPLSRNSSYSSNYQADLDLDDKSYEPPNDSHLLLTPIVGGNYSITDQFMTTNNYDDDDKDETKSNFSNQSCNTSCSSTPAFASKELANFENTKRIFERECAELMNSNASLSKNTIAHTGRKLFTTSLMSNGHLGERDEDLSKCKSEIEQLKCENKQLKTQIKKYIDAIALLPCNGQDAIFQCAMRSVDVKKTREKSSSIDNLSSEINQQTSQTQNDFQHENDSHKSAIREAYNNEAVLDCEQKIESQFDTSAYLDYRDSVEYERKLVEVAQMFGEIVEYNDRLNRVLMQKDAMIKVLKDQLIELRGPLPDTIQSDDEEIASIVSVSPQSPHHNSILAQNIRPLIPLISIWIPSAFLADQKQTYQNTYLDTDQNRTNKKSSSHHVYQIYIRIKDDEWLVYRRYSQFYSIHQILRKKYPQINDLDFPPKKTIGNRHAKVVQERRKKLEAYLRDVLNILQNDNNIFDRSTLIEVLPFLSEKYVFHNKRNEASVKTTNRDLNADAEEAIVQQQDYVGL